MIFGTQPISVTGTGIEATLDRLIANAVTVEATAFREIREDFQAIEARRFRDEGPGWPALAPETVRRKRSAKYPQPDSILYATGDLLFSLAGETEHTVFEVRPSELLMGTNLGYAAVHQAGNGRIPRRPVIEIDEKTARRWAELLEEALMAGVHGGGPPTQRGGRVNLAGLARSIAHRTETARHLLHTIRHGIEHGQHLAERAERGDRRRR